MLLYFGYLLMAVGIFGVMHLLRHRAVVLGHVGLKMLGMSDEEWEHGVAPARENADPRTGGSKGC